MTQFISLNSSLAGDYLQYASQGLSDLCTTGAEKAFHMLSSSNRLELLGAGTALTCLVQGVYCTQRGIVKAHNEGIHSWEARTCLEVGVTSIVAGLYFLLPTAEKAHVFVKEAFS